MLIPIDFPAMHNNFKIFSFDDHGIYTKFEIVQYIRNKEREGYHESKGHVSMKDIATRMIMEHQYII